MHWRWHLSVGHTHQSLTGPGGMAHVCREWDRGKWGGGDGVGSGMAKSGIVVGAVGSEVAGDEGVFAVFGGGVAGSVVMGSSTSSSLSPVSKIALGRG